VVAVLFASALAAGTKSYVHSSRHTFQACLHLKRINDKSASKAAHRQIDPGDVNKLIFDKVKKHS